MRKYLVVVLLLIAGLIYAEKINSPEYLSEKEAVEIISKVFKDYGISLKYNQHLKIGEAEFEVDGYNSQLKIGFEYISNLDWRGKPERAITRQEIRELQFLDEANELFIFTAVSSEYEIMNEYLRNSTIGRLKKNVIKFFDRLKRKGILP